MSKGNEETDLWSGCGRRNDSGVSHQHNILPAMTCVTEMALLGRRVMRLQRRGSFHVGGAADKRHVHVLVKSTGRRRTAISSRVLVPKEARRHRPVRSGLLVRLAGKVSLVLGRLAGSGGGGGDKV